MKSLKAIATVGLVVMVSLSCVALAGWQRSNGSTRWVDRPSPTTLWGREPNTDELYPVEEIMVYNDTIQYLVTSSTVSYATGYWVKDSAGLYVPADVATNQYSIRKSGGAIVGIEWEIDSTGYLIPKD
jgi:hypothetical protein